MIKVSSSLPDIAVIRGGNKDFKLSLQEGVEVLQSLTKIGYQPLDVLVDTDGKWTMHGVPTDAHEVFTQAHTVVDTTRMTGEAYQDLAKKMGIPLLFSHDDKVCMDREICIVYYANKDLKFRRQRSSEGVFRLKQNSSILFGGNIIHRSCCVH
jgi:hypothetical protein